jgi:hypothetical protein
VNNACQTASTDQNGNPTPFCTHDCESNSDCEAGEFCISYEGGQSFCWYPCQSANDCINSQTDTCNTGTGLCTGETGGGQVNPSVDAGPCVVTGCGSVACEDNCGNADLSCTTECSSNPGYNTCGALDSSCGSVPDAGPFVTIPLGGCPFLGYDAPVTIDTQSFQLDIDTGSTTTFVAAASCSNCDVSPEYNPPASADTGQTTQSAYGSGDVEGDVYTDTVRVGNEMPTVTLDFGGITSQQQFFLQEDCSGGNGQQGEGILGLGPIDLDTIGMNSSDAYFTDLVASSMGLADIFAVNLCTSGGNLWFGGYDTSYASGAPEYTPLVNNMYWGAAITSIGLGSTTFSNSGDSSAVVDTGTGSFLMPSSAYSALVSALNSNAEATSIFGSGALQESFDNGTCVSPTGNQTQAEIDAALPQLVVIVPKVGGGSITLSMPATQSYLALMGGQYCGAAGDNSQASGQTIWGAPALRAYITIFDIANSQIGFAPQSSCQ